MARRIKSRKRKHLGNRTFGGGNTKNRRGKGNKGGKGRAGMHKHKWLQTIKLGLHKPGKPGFHSAKKRPREFTLEEISRQITSGKWQKQGDAYSVDLGTGSKVIASGSMEFPAEIRAQAFSQKAVQKIEEAGGRALKEFDSDSKAQEKTAGEQN